MTRPLRINLEGGWYHVTARGNNRQAIYADDRDRDHFLDLVGEMVERYGVRLHAYVLMTNHYHLLVETPGANVSRAIQWLNVSYSVWYNKRQECSGHVFQGRFYSVLIESEAWGLEVSEYLHLNPVRVAGLGLGKPDRKQERAGRRAAATKEEVSRWLKVLRGYRWSSYRAYAGYERGKEWLTKDVLWRRVKGRARGGAGRYRREVEKQVKGEQKESPWQALKAGVVLGREAFVERVRQVATGDEREQPGLKALRVRVSFEDVVRAVEEEKGATWEQFYEKQGDWGRDLVLAIARRQCGLTLETLGKAAGGLRSVTVSMAIRRLAERLASDKKLQQTYRRIMSDMCLV
jgi:REP element-mobilizing transposase RayT